MDLRLEILVVILSLELKLHVETAEEVSFPRNPYWPKIPWKYSKGGNWVPIYSQRRSHIGPPPHVNEVMTEWSQWGPWDKCSRSCGGGVTSRKRTCVSRYPRVMPGSGIRTSHDRCTGQSLQYQVCGTDPCPAGQISAISFRSAQCRRHNNRRVLGRVVNNWVPYNQGGINPCALVCEGEGEGIVYTFGKVIDGTHCKTDVGHKGLCINGRCLRLSCDGRLGGTANEDMCRVCGGANDTCTKHVGVYHFELPSADQPIRSNDYGAHVGELQKKRKSFGYYEVTKIPTGSTNVKITDNSPNFLALKSSDKYLLNGDWLIDWPGEVDAAGTTFSYVRQEDQSEDLSSLGPTKEEIILMVLLRDDNPGIYYEYWIPNAYSRQRSTNATPVSSIKFTDRSTSTTSTTTPAPHPSVKTTLKPPSSVGLKPAILTSLSFNSTLHHLHPEDDNKSDQTLSANDSKQYISPLKNQGLSLQETVLPYLDNRIVSLNKLSNSSISKFKSNIDTFKDLNLVEIALEEKSKNAIYSNISANNIANNVNTTSPKDSKRKKWRRDQRDRKKKKRRKKKKGRSNRPRHCSRCVKQKRAKHGFCTSEFVSLVDILSEETVGNYRRLEVSVVQSYKNIIPLLHKEFLWQHKCSCRHLRKGKSYVVMGTTEPGKGREVRLVLQEDSFTRKFSPKVLSKLVKFRNDELRVCNPWRKGLKISYSKLKKYLFSQSQKTRNSSSDNKTSNLVT